MGITSLQVCMDSSDWLQATISEDGTGMDTSSPITTPTGDDAAIHNLTCSRPLIERRLRPQHEQSLKCPRCDSTHTKFCYYNNYSLSQPRYFCKTCRRYWTKGGTLRNIPVGGGCRKNKKSASSSSSSKNKQPSGVAAAVSSSSTAAVVHSTAPPMLCYDYHSGSGGCTDLQLAFPEQLQFSGMFGHGGNPNFPIEFLDGKYEALIGASHDFVGNGAEGFGTIGNGEFLAASGNFHSFCSPLGFSAIEHGSSSAAVGVAALESCQPYNQHHHHQAEIDVKPAKMLSIEWNDHQQACNSDAGYSLGGLGSWTGLMNGYGSSATNPLV